MVAPNGEEGGRGGKGAAAASEGAVSLALPEAKCTVRYAYVTQRGYYPDAPDKVCARAGVVGGRCCCRRSHCAGDARTRRPLLPPPPPSQANQDAVCTYECVAGSPDLHMFGVFDGHGEFGAECAQFAQTKVRGSERACASCVSGGRGGRKCGARAARRCAPPAR